MLYTTRMTRFWAMLFTESFFSIRVDQESPLSKNCQSAWALTFLALLRILGDRGFFYKICISQKFYTNFFFRTTKSGVAISGVYADYPFHVAHIFLHFCRGAVKNKAFRHITKWHPTYNPFSGNDSKLRCTTTLPPTFFQSLPSPFVG